MSKRCVEDSGLTTLPPPPPQKKIKKFRRSNIMRGGHVYCVREKAIRSFTSTSLAHMVVETRGKRHVKSILLLSLNAHSHVDDYSGTLGSVRKVHVSALVTSHKN